MTHIGLFSPAGYVTDATRPALLKAQSYFEAQGCQVTIAPHALGQHQRFSGTFASRLADINFLLDDSSINVWLAIRGGYGCIELLPHLPYDKIQAAVAQGVKICGHSDLNTLQLALLSQADIPSYVGPMATYDFGQESLDLFMADYFWRMVNGASLDVEFDCAHSYEKQTLLGKIWGGNLTVFSQLLATPYLPKIEGGILFFEDINEHPYRIERMLFQLLHTGILTKQKALLLGDFSGYKLSDYDQGYDFDTMLARIRDYCPIPVITNFPFGHCQHKATIALGAQIALKIKNSSCALNYL